MAWTKRQLDEAVVAYERALVEAGHTRGTVNTYVGDARRFVEWLAGGGAERPTRGAPRAQHVARLRRAGIAKAILAPAALRKLVEAWHEAGELPQIAIPWPRERWEAAFPGHGKLFRSLPSEPDRAAVRRACATATTSDRAAEDALLATLAWGFGWVGYGPHRADIMLRTPQAAKRLRSVAEIVASEGPIPGYRSLAGDNRIARLGPAFGTKFLAFCQPDRANPAALIHDEVVTAWLEANGRPDLRATTWAPVIYEAYLDQMHVWAKELGVAPETLEFLMFQAEADRRGNQWARPL